MLRRWIGRVMLALLGLLTLTVSVALVQAQGAPRGRPEYVALGSSYAAGAALGPLQDGSPWLCARSADGYPQQLARLRRLSIVDMSCGGAVTRHLLRGGQFFQGAQVRTITPQTRLVTITVGGNDIAYIGDLSLLAGRHSSDAFGWAARTFWSGPKPLAGRDWSKLERELVATIRAARTRAPGATIVVATYPTVLPPTGTCPRLALTAAEVKSMRLVADRLADTTRAAANEAGAVLVDMHRLGAAHHACAADPWTTAWKDAHGAPFHPTLAGARATAAAISSALP